MNPIMEALQNHLGGGAPSPAMGPGGPGPDGPGLPPALMGAIQSGSAGPPDADAGAEQSEDALLDKVITDLHKWIGIATEPEDKAVGSQCLTQLQKIKAKDQADSDGAMSGKVSPRVVRKTASSVGGPGGSGY